MRPQPLDASPGTFLTHHVVVPAAVIAMASSFLFFLVDLRSAYLGGGPSLKWIGFCFVVATVLNERYGRSSDEAHLKGFYTLALAAATAFVLLVAPWETPPGRFEAKLANLLILAVVWHFATRVTRELSPETGRDAGESILAKLDLLLIDPWRSDETLEAESPPEPQEAPPVKLRNPAVTVARLAAAALLVFALGEPIILGATPQTGPRALAAVVVFLFSTSIVLAAGSALDALRRAEAAGGRVAPGVIPGRMGLAALLLGAVLAAALAMPGLSFQGTGRLRPPVSQQEGVEQERGNQETEHAGRPGPGVPGEVTGSYLRSDKGDPSKESAPQGSYDEIPVEPSRLAKPAAGPAGDLSGWLAAAGKWFLIPLILPLIVLGIWRFMRRRPHLKKRKEKGARRRRSLLDRLTGLLGRLPLFRRRTRAGADPLAGLDDLSERPAREAVLAAYHRFLVLLESLGHTRPARATPYETLQGLPPHLQPLEGPARTLTDLYVLAAYAAEPVERGDRERAIGVLREMRGLVERPGG
jgi:hypothetical protein